MARWTIAWHWSGSVTSVWTLNARLPADVTNSAVSLSFSTRRAASTTSAPASAHACAKATPRPEDAPVTMTTLPSRRNMSIRFTSQPHVLGDDQLHHFAGATVDPVDPAIGE